MELLFYGFVFVIGGLMFLVWIDGGSSEGGDE